MIVFPVTWTFGPFFVLLCLGIVLYPSTSPVMGLLQACGRLTLTGHQVPIKLIYHSTSSAWSTSSRCFFPDLGVYRVVSHILTPLSQLLLCSSFFPFLNMLSERCYHHRWWAWPWSAVGPSWSQLALALLDTAKASGISQKPLLQPSPSATKTLPRKPNTRL